MNGGHDMGGDSAHRATQECLPWLLNGTLGKAEREAAQAHLQECTVCQAELAGLRSLREAGRTAGPPCELERAWAQMQARLEASPHLPQGMSGAQRAANDPRWLRHALFAQCGVIVLLAVLLAWQGAGGDAWRALGAVPAMQGQAMVVFRPETSERELRRIVRASGAHIVGGPTVTDAWVLALPDGQSAVMLKRLRAEPAVLLAEPLTQEGRP